MAENLDPGLHFWLDKTTMSGGLVEMVRPVRRIYGIDVYDPVRSTRRFAGQTVTAELARAYAAASGQELFIHDPDHPGRSHPLDHSESE